jgi:2-C-methyl-D-erythritol 4-phosphate cytidylyltransferase
MPNDALIPPAADVFISHAQPRCFALVPCAGVGLRAGVGGPKQYHRLAGRTVVAHTLAALAGVARIEAVLIVLSPEDDQFEAAVADELPASPGQPRHIARCGGATRADTVANGLVALMSELGAAEHDWVLVHDAARCLLEPAWVERLIAECDDDEVGGLLALPLADTLKQARVDPVPDGGGGAAVSRVADTVDRAGKWAAQTPQMFRLGLLRRALAHAASDPQLAAGITDEASAIEALGHAPRLVRGHLMNLKVTWPEDFAVAERWVMARHL